MFLAFAMFAMWIDADAGVACAATARDVAAGEHLSADMLVSIACEAGKHERPRLRFDPLTRTVVAEEMLPSGAYLGRLRVSAAPLLPKGTKLTLRATAGVASVEREVVTLQPARSGQRVFVRDSDGGVFAAMLTLPDAGAADR